MKQLFNTFNSNSDSKSERDYSVLVNFSAIMQCRRFVVPFKIKKVTSSNKTVRLPDDLSELQNNFADPEQFIKFAIKEIFYIVAETSMNLAEPFDGSDF